MEIRDSIGISYQHHRVRQFPSLTASRRMFSIKMPNLRLKEMEEDMAILSHSLRSGFHTWQVVGLGMKLNQQQYEDFSHAFLLDKFGKYLQIDFEFIGEKKVTLNECQTLVGTTRSK